MRARRALGLLPLLLLGCSVEQPAETVGCKSLADCSFTEVCDLPREECVPIPEDGFKGGFRCSTVRLPGEPVASAPGSEIVGSVGGDRWSFPVGANCWKSQLTDTVFLLVIQVLPTAGFDALDIVLEWDAAQSGSVNLQQTWMFHSPNSATLWTPDTERTIAHAGSGTVSLSGAPAVGAPLDGYVDIDMNRVVDDEVLYGVPCPRGVADCGWNMSKAGAALMCKIISFQDGSTHDVCTHSCQTDADCAAGEGICNLGDCSRPCSSDADCLPPLVCAAGNPGESKGCF